jgi:cell division septal protein FtsQ
MSDLDDELARADRNLGASDTRDDRDADSPRDSAKAAKKKSRFSKPGWKIIGGLLLVGIILAAGHYTLIGLRAMAFFRVRTIEIRGTHYLQPTEIVARMHVDTLRSLWDDVRPLENRIRPHPQVSDVKITRRLPGTLVVTLRENLPVALIPTATGLQPYDSLGRELPIDPLRTDLDLPVIASPDPAMLRLLGEIRRLDLPMYQRVSEVKRTGRNDLLLILTSSFSRLASPLDSTAPEQGVLRVRAPVGVTVDRLTDIFPVESDLVARQARIGELDLRYRDQVIARIQ